MRKARRTLPVVLPALAVLGMLAAAGHAGKPLPPAFPTLVKLTGGIEIQATENTADPTHAGVEFIDNSLRIAYRDATYTTGQEFISNPDYTPGTSPDTPSLWVTGAGANMTLQYFYCAHVTHAEMGSADTRCQYPETYADHYYCLVISGGKTQKKTGAVVFPAGSAWRINKKTPLPGVNVALGTLTMPVTYQVLR